MMVTTGIKAFRKACFHNAPWFVAPFALAVRMKSSFKTSSKAERVTRVRMADWGRARAIVGHKRDLRVGIIPASHPANPPPGNHLRVTENTIVRSMANQKLGMAIPSWEKPVTKKSIGLL